MLPSRSRLERWNPDSLSFTGAHIKAGGQAVDDSVVRVRDNLGVMPETKAWSGAAHDEADKMFGRATEQTRDFADHNGKIGQAFVDGAGSIGGARTGLLNKADEIDRGDLYVSDGWVVLIKAAPMSEEKVAALMALIEAEQAVINELLLAVGAADDAVADAVMAGAAELGFVAPSTDGLGGLMIPGLQRPDDEVPNPSNHIGLFQQAVMRGEEMATTVREVKEEIVNHRGDYGEPRKTLIMQDGSKQVLWEFGPPGHRHMTTTHYDPDDKMITTTDSWIDMWGNKRLDIEWADGTMLNGSETPDGVIKMAFTLPDGRYGVLPPDNPLLTGAVPTTVGGAMTGLSAHVGRGGSLPMLDMDATKNVGAGAKFGGPALGVLTTAYSMASAETPYDACVSGFAGGFQIVGEIGGGAAGVGVASSIPGAQGFVPFAAVGGAYVGGQWMNSLGTKVGEVFCK